MGLVGVDVQRFPHGRWLLCNPKHFDVTYEINPWMSIQRSPLSDLAASQWQCLHHTLIRLGAWVEYVEPQPGNPDLVFTTNAGLVRDSKVVLSRFAYPERAGEEPIFREWFERNGYSVVTVHKGTFEGEGDALFAGDTLFAGHGFRSTQEAYDEVAQELNVKKLVFCEMVDSRFYHLDTCFCPLNATKALVVPGAFSTESLTEMGKHIELLPVCDEDAERFVCNTVVLGSDLVQPAGCDRTYAMLNTHGFSSHPVPLGEFLKGGGSAKCLSLQLDRLQVLKT